MSDRKRKIGERKPSPALSKQVNALTDGEFVDLIEMVTREDYAPGYVALYRWHRGRQPYDPDAEQEALGEYDVPSLRKYALKRLHDCIAELRSGIPQEYFAWEQSLETTPLIPPRQMMEAIQQAKAHAAKRGYYGRLARLLVSEERVARAYLKGRPLARGLSRIADEARQAQANLELAPQVAYHRREYLEMVRQGFYATGLIDRERVAEYLNGDFFKIDVSGYPERLVVDKLIIDEFFLLMNDQIKEASHIANVIHRLHQASGVLSPTDHASFLRRLAEYSDRLADREGLRRVIGYYEEVEPSKDNHFQVYMTKYLAMLCFATVDTGEMEYADTAEKQFLQHEARFREMPDGKDKYIMMTLLAMHRVGRNNIKGAKELFDELYKARDPKPPLVYRVMYMLTHLIILFETMDGEAMRTFSKNYLRFMEFNLPATEPAIAVLRFLSKHVNRTYPNAMHQHSVTLLGNLHNCRTKPDFEKTLHFSAITRWLEHVSIRSRR